MALIDKLASDLIIELGLIDPEHARGSTVDPRMAATISLMMATLSSEDLANLPEEQITDQQRRLLPADRKAQHTILAAIAVAHQVHHQLGGCTCPAGS